MALSVSTSRKLELDHQTVDLEDLILDQPELSRLQEVRVRSSNSGFRRFNIGSTRII